MRGLTVVNMAIVKQVIRPIKGVCDSSYFNSHTHLSHFAYIYLDPDPPKTPNPDPGQTKFDVITFFFRL